MFPWKTVLVPALESFTSANTDSKDGTEVKIDLNESSISTRIPKDKESVDRSDFTLLGFNYLGPGNELDKGPPTNAVDAIAKTHDEAYDYAMNAFKETKDIGLSVQKVKEADKLFLQQMLKTRATSVQEMCGKAVGLVGIGVKAAIEIRLGRTLYPQFKEEKPSGVTGNVGASSGDKST